MKGFRQIRLFFLAITVMLVIVSCGSPNEDKSMSTQKDSIHSCMQVPARFGKGPDTAGISFNKDTSYSGMVLIPGGIFEMGGDNDQASEDEFPKHKVKVAFFYMDVSEVTNAQFQQFVDATGYVTTAEQTPDWNELKKRYHPVQPSLLMICW